MGGSLKIIVAAVVVIVCGAAAIGFYVYDRVKVTVTVPTDHPDDRARQFNAPPPALAKPKSW